MAGSLPPFTTVDTAGALAPFTHIPEGKQLFDYQIEGALWLSRQKTCLLADEQRLGKAVQSIAALDIIKANRALVVCRGVARANWASEFAAWSNRGWVCATVYGSDFELCTKTVPYAIITSYESLEKVLSQLPPDFKFDSAIIDESHYVKSLDAKRTRLVFGREHLPKKTSRLWCTTGTPTPNHAAELWTTLFTFGATKLPYWDFAKRFCIVVENGYGSQIVGTNMDPERLRELHSIMDKKMLRRTAEDVKVQLPTMSFSCQMVRPGPVELGATSFWKYKHKPGGIEELNRQIALETGIVEGILKNDTLSDELLEALKGAAKSISTLRRFTALQKLPEALDLIESELESGAYQKCVIFAHHRDCILGAAQRLFKYYPVTMYGGTAPARLEKNLRHFQDPKHRTRVFIGQISAAGTSISLNAANHIFFLEESFVPGDNMQAAMRCGGVNQPNPIFVRTFCLENSIDQRVQTILMKKMNEISKIYKRDATTNDEILPDLPADMI